MTITNGKTLKRICVAKFVAETSVKIFDFCSISM